VETFQKLNPSVSIFWIEAGSVSQLEQNCFKIIDDIGLERPNGSQPGLVDLKSWFDSIESGDWLIVYDGVDSQSSLYGEHQLHKYIPRFSRGAIIFTSRNKQVIVDLLDSSAIVQVDGMPSDDAENLLLNRSGNSPHLSKHISELLLKLEYIPWAIIQAASFIAKNCISIDGYFEYYTKDEAQRIQLLNRLFPNVMSQADFKSAIETWFMSFKIIEDENEAAISLLSYLAMIDKDRIPTFILPEEHNALEQTVALGLLRSHSMLIVDPKTGLLYLNGLARMFMREYLRSRNLFEQYHNKAQLYLLQQYPESFTQTSDFIKGKVIIHHVKSTYDVDTRQCVRMETMNTPLLLSLADHLFRIGQYNSALEYANFLISITRDFDGVENNDQAAARNVVGLCHMHLAEFKKAKLEFELGIDCAENGTLMHDKIRNGIGWLSYLQGAYESAADIFQSILKTEGDESSDREVLRQDVLTNYGLTKQAQGQLNKAETALREVLDRRQATQSSGFTKTIDAYSNLATILQRKRQWKEALFYHCEVLRKRLEFLDENNHDCLRSRANIALVLVEQGDLQASEPILLGLLEEFSNILGLNHPETLNLKNNIVNILHQRSLFNEAVCLGKDVLAGRIKTLGHSHPDTVIIHDYCDRMDAWRKEQGLERTNEITVL
jgi:tetratricopeptide (TPR) repeat protein